MSAAERVAVICPNAGTRDRDAVQSRLHPRAKIKDVTLRDIRAKAATDAKKQGYADTQLQVALAHTDAATTRDYIRTREVPVSKVRLRLPTKQY